MELELLALFAIAGEALQKAGKYCDDGTKKWDRIVSVRHSIEILLESEVNGTWPVETPEEEIVF